MAADALPICISNWAAELSLAEPLYASGRNFRPAQSLCRLSWVDSTCSRFSFSAEFHLIAEAPRRKLTSTAHRGGRLWRSSGDSWRRAAGELESRRMARRSSRRWRSSVLSRWTDIKGGCSRRGGGRHAARATHVSIHSQLFDRPYCRFAHLLRVGYVGSGSATGDRQQFFNY